MLAAMAKAAARTPRATTAAAPAPFAGFAKDAPRFFHELAAEMNRDWFTAHKAEYEALWVTPMTALLAEVRTGLVSAYRGLTLAPPRLFRIHRDVRFAKDKTPYKTHCGGLLSLGDGPVMESGAAPAPCVMAMSHCPPDMPHGGLPMDQLAIGDCDALAAADCRISGVERLVSAVPVVDFSIIPVRLHSLPADAALHLIRVPDRYANVILPPPLNLQHAKLLI